MLNEEVKCNLGLSKIHGIGVFAIRDIKKGEHLFPVSEATVEVDPSKFVGHVKTVVLDRNVFYQDKQYIEHPNLEVNYTAFMNHSDTPNSDGIYAILDIKKGDEITESYRHNSMSKVSKNHFTFL